MSEETAILALESIGEFTSEFIAENCDTDEDLLALACMLNLAAIKIYRHLGGHTHAAEQLKSVVRTEESLAAKAAHKSRTVN